MIDKNLIYSNLNFYYLLGALLGDGCLYINKNSYQFSITSSDLDLCENCQDIVINLFNKSGKIKTVYKNNKISYYQLVVCSKDIVYFLKEETNNKTIFPKYIYSNKLYLINFIKGLMDSDGWICKVKASDGYIRYRIGFKNTANWIVEFKSILNNLNVKTGKLLEVKHKKYKKCWYFSINTLDFCDKIGFNIRRKKRIEKEFLNFIKNKDDRKLYK